MSAKISIILCTYNEVNHIENIISELEKNISNLEIVIVDDNSSDGTVEAIKKLIKKTNIKLCIEEKAVAWHLLLLED